MDDALETKLASPYKLNDAGDLVRGAYPTFFGSSAGLVASVSDYAKYIVALKEKSLPSAANTSHRLRADQV